MFLKASLPLFTFLQQFSSASLFGGENRNLYLPERCRATQFANGSITVLSPDFLQAPIYLVQKHTCIWATACRTTRHVKILHLLLCVPKMLMGTQVSTAIRLVSFTAAEMPSSIKEFGNGVKHLQPCSEGALGAAERSGRPLVRKKPFQPWAVKHTLLFQDIFTALQHGCKRKFPGMRTAGGFTWTLTPLWDLQQRESQGKGAGFF